MLLISLSPLRFRNRLRSLVASLGFVSICCFAQPMFFAVKSTPYDHQMARVYPILAPTAHRPANRISLVIVNQWMNTLRAIPYRYSRQWKTPEEVQSEQYADCKGKALFLYEEMRAMGAKNVRFVIGKRHAGASLTHAWVEWDAQFGTCLLDPTFNWMATPEPQDGSRYIPFYAYDGSHKYQAANSLLVNRTLGPRSPAAPSQGTITRPSRSTWKVRSSPWLFDEGPISPRSFSNRTAL